MEKGAVEIITIGDEILIGQIVDTKTGGYIPDMYKKKEKITLNLAVGGSFFRSLR